MEKLKEIMVRVMEVPPEEVNENFSRDREEWDSFNHLSLLSLIEKEMGISFTLEEVESIKTVGDIERIISEKNGTS